MADKIFEIGRKYSPRQLMELAVQEMEKSRSEHTEKPDPKVGAVLATTDGILIEKAHRGEVRIGNHAEFTIFERKLLDKSVEDSVLYTTLEPCIERNAPKKGCTYRAIDARVGKVVIGHIDPDPDVAGDAVQILENAGITVEYFDKDLEEFIDRMNSEYFRAKERLAKGLRDIEISPVFKPLETELSDFELADFSEEAQQELITRMELPYKLGSGDFVKFLVQFGFSKRTKSGIKPTGLGLLLLGKTPQYNFPQSRVKFTVHRENEEPKIKDFEGPILLMPSKIEDYLDIIIPAVIDRSKFHRTELSDVPKKALREVIINAIVHRDYLLEGAKIMVDVHPDRIEVISPGKPKFALEKFKSFTVPSISRNPKIAYIFNQMSLVEERGLGMKELKKLLNAGYRKPDFKLEDDLFSTIIYRSDDENAIKRITDDNSIVLYPSEQTGYEFLQQTGELSSSSYADHFSIDPRTARRHLNKMVDKGLAIRKGDGPSTVYRIKTDE